MTVAANVLAIVLPTIAVVLVCVYAVRANRRLGRPPADLKRADDVQDGKAHDVEEARDAVFDVWGQAGHS